MQLFSTRLRLLTEKQTASLFIYAMQLGFSLSFLLIFCTPILPSLAQQVTKEFTVSSFERINVSSSIEVEVRKGNFSVEIDLPPGNTKYLTVRSTNGILYIRFNHPATAWLSSRKNHKSPRVLVTLPILRGITLSGASDGDIKSSFNFDELDIELSGSSNLKISDLTAKSITLKASGASDTRLQGKAQILRAELSGASDLKGYRLTVEEAIIKANGASDASITVTKRLEKYVQGGANISYHGNPPTIVNDLKRSDQ